MTSGTIPTTLVGQAVLVVEDEYFIARDIVDELRTEGAVVRGPFSGVREAMRLIGAGTPIGVAVLDVNLRGEMIWPVVDELIRLGVPVVLTTGYDAGAIPFAYAHLPRLEKPVSVRDIVRIAAGQVGTGTK